MGKNSKLTEWQKAHVERLYKERDAALALRSHIPGELLGKIAGLCEAAETMGDTYGEAFYNGLEPMILLSDALKLNEAARDLKRAIFGPEMPDYAEGA